MLGTGVLAWGKVLGCHQARGTPAEPHSRSLPPLAPAQFRSSQTPPRLGLPPSVVPPLTLATASSEPVRSATPGLNTRPPSHTPPELRRQRHSTPAPARPGGGEKPGDCRAPYDGSFKEQPPPPRSRPPPRAPPASLLGGSSDQAGVGGQARVERAQGRGDPSPFRPRGNRVHPIAIQCRRRAASQGKGGRNHRGPPPQPQKAL